MLKYAQRIAIAVWEKHWKNDAPQWKPVDDLGGVLSQIDNMVAGMTRKPTGDKCRPIGEGKL